MVQVGLPIGETPPIVPMGLVAGREIEIIGSHGFAADDLDVLLHWIETRRFDTARMIHQRVSLVEGAMALESMDTGSPLGITMITEMKPSKL